MESDRLIEPMYKYDTYLSVGPKCRATKVSTNAHSINCNLEIAKMNKSTLRRSLLKD
jgi:hypothetical protein